MATFIRWPNEPTTNITILSLLPFARYIVTLKKISICLQQMSSLQIDQWQTLATTQMQSYWWECREQQQQHHSDNNNNKICWFLYDRTCLYILTAVSCFFDSVGLIFTTITVRGWAFFELFASIFNVIIMDGVCNYKFSIFIYPYFLGDFVQKYV